MNARYRFQFASFVSGRPLVHAGKVIVAPRLEGPAWIDDLTPEVNRIAAGTRKALARAWLDDALAEHASIAAFTRVSMQLMAVGAPPELVDEAHQAARDEVRHARQCFTFASMYGGRWEEPGALPVDAIRQAVCTVPTLAREALIEGCLGEGVAAGLARMGAEQTDDPEAKRILVGIADDEERHCELAWKILGWCLQRDPQAAGEVVATTLRVIPTVVVPTALAAEVDVEQWRAAGRLAPEQAAEVHSTVARELTEVVWQHPVMQQRRSASVHAQAKPVQPARPAATMSPAQTAAALVSRPVVLQQRPAPKPHRKRR